ncbi:MAG: hypothetical protein U0667_08555 [Chloroflexota bacterium]
MTEAIQRYLEAIDATATVRKRQNELLDLMRPLCPEPIEEIFLTDYLADGLRTYENLWAFGANYVMEAKKFLSQVQLDLTWYRGKTKWVEWTWEDFVPPDSVEAGASMHVKTSLTDGLAFDMRATGHNCAELYDLIRRRVLPGIGPSAKDAGQH